MKKIPTIRENPDGLHQRYVIRKVTGIGRDEFDRPKLFTKAVDEGSEYFVMRLDDGGKDKVHVDACRKAVLHYAELIKDHLPELSKDLIKRYGQHLQTGKSEAVSTDNKAELKEALRAIVKFHEAPTFSNPAPGNREMFINAIMDLFLKTKV